MISVIISTRIKDDKLIDAINKNCGVDNLEILIYENNGENSLTKIYNKGLSESKNNIVVFMHDDVEINTKNWGLKLIDHFNNSDYGILGVAGTKSLSNNGVWWSSRESMYGHIKHTDNNKTWQNNYSFNFMDKLKDVVVVDGVFFACDKNRIKKFFNEIYDGFHFYDISFCFDNFKEGVKVGVFFDIMMTHKSIGETNEKWEENRQKFITNEYENLPASAYIEVPFVEPKIIIKNEKKMGIIIPTKNKVDELLIPCINSLLETKYSNYNIYVADTGSDELEIKKFKSYMDMINHKNNRDLIRLIEYDYYNFAKINNDVVKNKIDKDTELILFCNNDIEMINDAISIMAEIYNKNNRCGTIGCRLHFEDGSIQHLGVSLQTNQKNELLVTHKYIHWDYENIKSSRTESLTHGNTAAFMLTPKDLFLEIGGFNEIYGECFEDVEYNLQCLLHKKINITTEIGACYHLESQTRDRKGEYEDFQVLLRFINSNPIIKNTFNKINT